MRVGGGWVVVVGAGAAHANQLGELLNYLGGQGGK